MKNQSYVLFFILVYTYNFVNSMDIITSEKTQHHTISFDQFIEYNCNKCNKIFSTQQGLRHHQKQHLKDEPYLEDENNLCLDKQLYQKKGPYTCDKCGKVLTTYNGFTVHKRGHLEIKPYPCNLCSRQFVQKNLLINHIKRHRKEKNYECSLCDKKFYIKYDLNIHKKLHERKKHTCDRCHKEFTNKYHFIEHIKKCTGQIFHESNTCHKKFSTKGNLNVHRKRMHERTILSTSENISNPTTNIEEYFPVTSFISTHFNNELSSDWIEHL